jgi:ABC-type thiamine transport system ATPase subunit
VAILGPPNAGKSTLLNILAKRPAAIVSLRLINSIILTESDPEVMPADTEQGFAWRSWGRPTRGRAPC